MSRNRPSECQVIERRSKCSCHKRPLAPVESEAEKKCLGLETNTKSQKKRSAADRKDSPRRAPMSIFSSRTSSTPTPSLRLTSCRPGPRSECKRGRAVEFLFGEAYCLPQPMPLAPAGFMGPAWHRLRRRQRPAAAAGGSGQRPGRPTSRGPGRRPPADCARATGSHSRGIIERETKTHACAHTFESDARGIWLRVVWFAEQTHPWMRSKTKKNVKKTLKKKKKTIISATVVHRVHDGIL